MKPQTTLPPALGTHLSPAQAGVRAGCATETVRWWLSHGQLPYTQTALGRLIAVADLDRFLATRSPHGRIRSDTAGEGAIWPKDARASTPRRGA